jgi:arsenate reductase
VAVAKEKKIAFEVVLYHKSPLTKPELQKLASMLEDPIEDLVRKDAVFKSLGLKATDFVGKKSAVVALLVEHPELMQRPVLVRGNQAIIGRPKDRIADFVSR